MTTKTAAPKCEETVWTHRRGGEFVHGYTAPCPNRARYAARWPGGTDGGWRLLCGTHANTDRWANYPDIEWRVL